MLFNRELVLVNKELSKKLPFLPAHVPLCGPGALAAGSAPAHRQTPKGEYPTSMARPRSSVHLSLSHAAMSGALSISVEWDRALLGGLLALPHSQLQRWLLERHKKAPSPQSLPVRERGQD